MRIAIGSDHGGFTLKQAIMRRLEELGHTYDDFGCYDTTSTDYPDVAIPLAKAVANEEYEQGILICSTGIGMSMVANKVKGIRAALCGDVFSARRARQHNDANILCLGEAVTGQGHAREIVTNYLSAEYERGRHVPRLKKMHSIEE